MPASIAMVSAGWKRARACSKLKEGSRGAGTRCRAGGRTYGGRPRREEGSLHAHPGGPPGGGNRQCLGTSLDEKSRNSSTVTARPSPSWASTPANPRGTGPGVQVQKKMHALPIGRGELRRQGEKIALLAFGSMLAPCLEAAEELNASVANMRFVKPLDDELVASLAASHDLLVTVEENTVLGGAGSAVTESLNNQRIVVKVLQLGLPDVFIDQGDHAQMLADCGLDKNGIIRSVRSLMD